MLVVSGVTGPTTERKAFARKVAELGYNVLLVDGSDMLNRSANAARNFNDTMALVRGSPNTTTSKASVIGFSLGGGAALLHAIHHSKQVSMLVTYQPATSWIDHMDGRVSRFSVPTLLMAAGKNTFMDCCPFDHARQIKQIADGKGRQLELVTYPDAEHGFDLPGRLFRSDDAEDAWKRSVQALTRLHPTKP